jgi:pyruvate dehydrogenase E2 component (dihydrolipoamide acetyltransferase)
MAQTVLMPQLGSTMEEGTILKWFKREGDSVAEGEPLLEIETDKATMEVPAETSGVLRQILHPENALVPIREPIAVIAAVGEAAEKESRSEKEKLPQLKLPTTDAQSTASPIENRKLKVENLGVPTPNAPVPISPRAARMADERGIPIMALAGKGTGPGGRIIERDVLAYQAPTVSETEAVPASPQRVTPLAARMADDLGRVRSADVLRHAEAHPAASQTTPVSAPASAEESVTRLPFAGMRKRIADNVAKSAFSAPHVTLTLEVDMTDCAAFRAQVLPALEKAHGVRVSFTDILVKAAAKALDEHPRLNATFDGETILLHREKNIGIAVALEEGLIVPVVRNVESKTLGTLATELKAGIERARTGKFTPDDLAGGTFTITNLGAFGIDVFDPVIVTGQTAILGVGRIAEKPAVRDGQVVVRSLMNLCLSFDHRIVDGAPAARFLQRLKELLESPLSILI